MNVVLPEAEAETVGFIPGLRAESLSEIIGVEDWKLRFNYLLPTLGFLGEGTLCCLAWGPYGMNRYFGFTCWAGTERSVV